MTTRMSEDERMSANRRLLDYLNDALEEMLAEVRSLRRQLAVAYWTMVMLSALTYLVGALLLGVPVYAALTGNIPLLQAAVAAGFGIASLVSLFLYEPITRLQRLMGDMSQLTVAVNTYQTEVGLRLIQLDINEKTTVGAAADEVREAAQVTLGLVQRYVEPAITRSIQKAASPAGSGGG